MYVSSIRPGWALIAAATGAVLLLSSLLPPIARASAYYNLAGFWKPSVTAASAPVARLVSTAYWSNFSGTTYSSGGSMDYSGFEISTTGVVNGELLILFGCIDNGNTSLWPQPVAPGFTQISQDFWGNDGETCVAAWKIANNEPASYATQYNTGTISGSSALALIAVSGADLYAPLDTYRVTFQTTGASQPAIGASTGVTTQHDNDLIIYATGQDWECTPGTSVFTAPTGYTSLAHLGDHGNDSWDWTSLQVASKTQALAGPTGVISGSQTGACNALTWTAAIAVAPRGSVSTQPPDRLAIISPAQTLSSTWACSGALMIQARDASNVVTAVSGSPLTVNLSGSPLYFSDPYCTVPITSTQIAVNSTFQTVYFEGTTAGTATVTAASPGLTSATQNETITALNPGTWIGGASCNGAWGTGACWQGGSSPNVTDTAHFDSNCTTNCTASLTTNITIGGLAMHPGASTTTFNLNNRVLNIDGDVRISGQTLTMAGTLIVQQNYVVTGGTINPANSTLTFLDTRCNFGNYYQLSLVGGATTYNNVSFIDYPQCNDGSVRNLSSTTPLKVGGTLTLASQGTPESYVSGGTIEAYGNVVLSNKGYIGDALIKIAGSQNQLIDSTGTTTGLIPSLEIASTGNTVTFNGNPQIIGDYKYTSGTVDFATHDVTLRFNDTRGNWSAPNNGIITPGTLVYRHVAFEDNGSGNSYGDRTLAAGSTMTISGNLTLGSATAHQNGVYGGTLDVAGNVTIQAQGIKTTSNINVGGNWINSTSAPVQATGGTVTFSAGANHTISGSNTFYGLSMQDSASTTTDSLTLESGKTQTINGSLVLQGNASHLLGLHSSSAGSQATITSGAATTLGGFLNVQDILVTGASTIHTGSGSIGFSSCTPAQNNGGPWVCP